MSVRNLPASVRQRLLNRARAEGRPFNELLQHYTMERFLYRLSQSASVAEGTEFEARWDPSGPWAPSEPAT
mgnify:CR=1 FL=1